MTATKKFLSSLILCGVLVGCATPEQIKSLQPQTPKESLVVANAALGATTNSIIGLYCPDPPECQLGVITKAQAQQLYVQTLQVSKLLDMAEVAINAGDPKLAEDQIAMAQRILLALKRQVTATQGAK